MIYDTLGIGFGPANLAFAVVQEERGYTGRTLFLEAREQAVWQQEMLLPGTDIQNHPLRDLVTPRNPRSRYTFVNYLHEHGLLFDHLNLGLEFPLRKEYAKYIAWVASFFSDRVAYGAPARQVELSPDRQHYLVTTVDGTTLKARALVVAPGRTVHIPQAFAEACDSRVFHSHSYLSSLRKLSTRKALRRVLVVGGSQSAIEIVLHLHREFPEVHIVNTLRGHGYRLKDTSQFSEEVYFPEFVDRYFNSSKEVRRELDKHLHFTNYSAADHDTIKDLYVRLYEDKLDGRPRVRLLTNSEPVSVDTRRDELSVRVQSRFSTETVVLDGLDAVILATGYRNLGMRDNQESLPAILRGLAPDLRFDDEGVPVIRRDYALCAANEARGLPPLYLNGLCESSHGYGDAGSFSLLALRSQDIFNSLIERCPSLPAFEANKPFAEAHGALA